MINDMVKEELYGNEFVKEKAVGMGQLVDEIINYPMNGQRESARYRQNSIPPELNEAGVLTPPPA